MNSIISPEIELALKRQKAKATISSLLIAILAVVLVGILLFLVAISSINLSQPDVVTYQAAAPQNEELEQKKINPSLQRKPSAPSSSTAKVIAANTASPTAIPVPDFDSPVTSVEFGDGDDFGAGWGNGDSPGAGGGTTFFGQESKAERVAFVIDYSASMRGEREKLMRAELSKSLEQLAPGTQYQMIFFAGPVWVAGSEVLIKGKAGLRENTVKSGNETYEWASSKGANGFKPKGKIQKATWLDVPSTDGKIGSDKRAAVDALKESQRIVEETELIWGTRWKYALEMALDMKPAPQVIFFMTDGSTGREAGEVAETVGKSAKRHGIVINCVAMMEPKAHEAMKDIAKRTGGKFTMVESGGKVKEIPLE